MTLTLPMEMMQEIHDESLAMCLDIAGDLMGYLVGNSLFVYGDTELTMQQRIERFVDFAERGVLDVLETMSPPTHDLLLREYEHDMKRLTGGMTATAEGGLT